MIIGDLVYDHAGNPILPDLNNEVKPAPKSHFDVDPGVLHRQVFWRYSKEEFEKACEKVQTLLSSNKALHILFQKPDFNIVETEYGTLNCFEMDMVYFVDPNFKQPNPIKGFFKTLFA